MLKLTVCMLVCVSLESRRVFSIGDIHGDHKLLLEAIGLMGELDNTRDKIIFTGAWRFLVVLGGLFGTSQLPRRAFRTAPNCKDACGCGRVYILKKSTPI